MLWNAEDANDDDLTYAVYFRGEGEKDWKLLKDKLDQRYYSWDTTSMPDGAYSLKVVASDAASNPPDEALDGERESDRFVVDNTPPDIADHADAAAAREPIRRYRALAPTTPPAPCPRAIQPGCRRLDAGLAGGRPERFPEEQYAIALHNLTPGEHTVTVRVTTSSRTWPPPR